jgi:hypothetical protein
MPHSQGEALEAASRALSKAWREQQDVVAMQWRRRFKEFTVDTVRAAAPTFAKDSSPTTFTAEDMRAEWAPWWCPADGGGDRSMAWRGAAAEGLDAPHQQRALTPPDYAAFALAMRDTRGAAGLDGWQCAELHALSAHCPWLISELHALLLRTTVAAEDSLPEQLTNSLFAVRVVGIPKRASDESRPIAVGSCVTRAWSRALLPQLPSAPDGQWCGRAGCGVVTATVDWAAADGCAGAEVDLRKAFDSVNLPAATAALEHYGTARQIVGWLRASWRGPRHCHVNGALAAALLPSRGLPPGCPCSPAVLGALLAPWTGLVHRKVPAARTWAYMDDRSLKGPDVATVTAALQVTADFDAAVGLEENVKKRQVWDGLDAVEHLGLRACGLQPQPQPQLPMPRDGWGPVLEAVRRLGTLPGSAHTREHLARAFVRPKFWWAAPLLEPPPVGLVAALRQSIISSRCTWWCAGRWWAERIDLHPVLGTAMQSLKVAAGLAASASDLLQHCVKMHAEALDLDVVAFDAYRGLWVRPRDSSPAQARAAGRAAHDAHEEDYGLPAAAFRPETPAGAHAARICARAIALATVHHTRMDSEGIDAIDLEAQSHPAWRAWSRSLTPTARTALAIWRGGAVWTPTRRWSRRRPEPARCPHCQAERASARHFWADCPRFEARRVELCTEYGMPMSWWSAQPRCTAKSGWITVAAGGPVARRAALQVAACRLGLYIMQDEALQPNS